MSCGRRKFLWSGVRNAAERILLSCKNFAQCEHISYIYEGEKRKIENNPAFRCNDNIGIGLTITFATTNRYCISLLSERNNGRPGFGLIFGAFFPPLRNFIVGYLTASLRRFQKYLYSPEIINFIQKSLISFYMFSDVNVPFWLSNIAFYSIHEGGTFPLII